jgi:hypothetical protein
VCIFAILSATSFASVPVLRSRIAEREHGLREHPGVQVDDLVEGRAHGGSDARMVVAQRGADLARGEVEDPLAGGGLDPGALGPRDRLRGK